MKRLRQIIKEEVRSSLTRTEREEDALLNGDEGLERNVYCMACGDPSTQPTGQEDPICPRCGFDGCDMGNVWWIDSAVPIDIPTW